MKRRSSKCMQVVVMAAGLWSLGTGLAGAQEQAPKPDHEVSFNAALTSDYRYRGISQSRLDPALQGGADYVHNPTGLYVGTWLSTIKWTKDLGVCSVTLAWVKASTSAYLSPSHENLGKSAGVFSVSKTF